MDRLVCLGLLCLGVVRGLLEELVWLPGGGFQNGGRWADPVQLGLYLDRVLGAHAQHVRLGPIHFYVIQNPSSA